MTPPDDPTAPTRTDSELLVEFIDHRYEPAFAEVVRRHGGMVLAVCRSVLGNTPDAEDAAQAVFLTLAQKAGHSSVRKHLVGWLHRVAWYVAARGAKARAIRRRHEEEATRMRNEILASHEEPLRLDALHAALNRLSEKYRVPLILHHLEGRSQAETAALLGCSVDAIAVRLHRARDMLRDRLGRLDRRGAVASAAVLAGAWGSAASAEVTPAFVATTSHAASAALAGELASAAAVSGQTLALTRGAINMLYWAKTKAVATALAIVLTVGGVVGTMLHANEAVAAAPTAITGVITKLQDGQITLRRRTGEVTVAIDKATVIKVDDAVATADALKVGMSTAAFVEGDKPATEVRAYSPKAPPAPPPPPAPPKVVTGLVSQVTAASIVIQPQIGPAITVAFDGTTRVKVNDRLAAAPELAVGMSVGVFYADDKPATEIRAYSRGVLTPP
ncbi:RNA polymerase sigma factor [Humisphaera borealis]|uniref:Sigma-70 family RNA polymerase sigma factor n=1 Tax=Humisphaera borealis TaxID=2807512 RepID=A0A7M2WZ74_9BACT|nr:sigma-70 family RNA polymerase sigma factor [Humisphaera borealis]QOV90502.1 sigma-70 family RNA polymerase sigma factor [Humisphaera borealis]